MKTILTLLLSICLSVCYADTLKITQDDPVTQREMYNDVKQVIAQLAESLSTTSEYLFSILVRQSIVSGIIGIIIQIAVYSSCIIWWLNLKRMLRWSDKLSDESDNEFGFVLIGVSGLVLAILFIIAVCSIQGTLTQIINPEYWALKEILDFVKQ